VQASRRAFRSAGGDGRGRNLCAHVGKPGWVSGGGFCQLRFLNRQLVAGFDDVAVVVGRSNMAVVILASLKIRSIVFGVPGAIASKGGSI
jgi:hypothetical protein